MVNILTSTATKWKAIAMLCVAGLSLSTLAADECGTATKPCEHRRAIKKIRSLQTSGVGHLAQGFQNSEHPCNHFKLTTKQVRQFLTVSGQVTQNDMRYVVDESACVVTGVVKFTGGKSQRFSIGEMRDGQLTNAQNQTEYLYCSQCPAPPFTE